MRRALRTSILLGVGFLLGRAITPGVAGASAGRGGGVSPTLPCASEGGDANGDGQLDISDAIAILGKLFLGSPATLAPICTERVPLGLPDTGQLGCLDAFGNVIPCSSDQCPGQDPFYANGCPMEGRFDDSGDGTVHDACTGLTWLKGTLDADGVEGTTQGDLLEWCDALSRCEALVFAGHADWRLPSVRELESIVDYDRREPAIPPLFEAEPSFYVSSTSYTGFAGLAWGVDFESGRTTAEGRTSGAYVRAVRGGR